MFDMHAQMGKLMETIQAVARGQANQRVAATANPT